MKIAIIGMNPYYESDRILVEALKNGHEAVYLSKKNIIETSFYNGGTFGIYFTPPTRDEQMKFPSLLEKQQLLQIKPDASYQPTIEKKGLLGMKTQKVNGLYNILYFDAILIREISKTLEWATILANHLVSHNKIVVDQKIGTEMYYKSKHGTFYKASNNGFPYPKTFAVTSKSMLLRGLEDVMYPVIVKKSESSKGLGVYKCESKQEVLDLLRYEKLKAGTLLIQECIKYNGDIRVFVIGDKVLGAMRREPQSGQWKGNVAQGAKAYPVDISDSVKKLALDVVKLQNSELIGVDIMMPQSGPVVIETNRAPQFKGFESSTGINVGQAIVQYLEKRFDEVSRA